MQEIARRSNPPLPRYACAVVSIMVAIGLRVALDPWLGAPYPFAFQYFAVLITAWYGGFGPALLSIAVGALATDYLIFPPRGEFGLHGGDQYFGMARYVAETFGIALLGGAMTRARRRAEASAEAEHRQREGLRVTLSGISDAVMAIDPGGRIVSINDAAATLTGWTVEAAAGRAVEDVFSIMGEGAEPTPSNPALVALREGAAVGPQNHAILRSRDGRETPIESSAAPIHDVDQRMAGVMLTFRDVTRRREAERSLRRQQTDLEEQVEARTADLRASEARYRQLVEFSLEAIWIHADGIIIYANPQAARMFGAQQPEDMIGRTAMALVHPDDRARAVERTSVVTTGGPSAALTVMKFIGAGGAPILLEVRATAMEYEGHRSVMAVGRDVTERDRLEEQLRQSQKLEAVGQLTGGIAHDFNNLLTVVICNLDLLQEHAPSTPWAAESLDLALKAALRGSDLTRRLVAFARRQALVPQAFNINERVTATVDLLQRTLGEQVEIKLSLASELWPAMADPAQFESALINLAINARDAMATGGRLTVETANQTLDADYVHANVDATIGEYVMLGVTDTGAGMAPEVIGRAFEPFFTTKSESKGSGLGLSMVYGFARQSQGHVKIYSEVGLGTTVRLYLPRTGGNTTIAATQKPAAIETARSGECILVVEDNPDVRKTVLRQLNDLGYRTLEASAGREALAILAAGERVDLMFSDVVMPGGMSGIELAAAARAARPGLKVLLTSGFANASLQSGHTSPDLRNLLSKPYRKTELAARLRKMLDTTG